MRLITLDDLLDIYLKGVQRGPAFILSKLNPSGEARTKSAFGESAVSSSNWWIVPAVKRRWNEKISGSPHISNEPYVMDQYLADASGLKMLSIGSGVASHERIFAAYPAFEDILCVDLVGSLLRQAEQQARESGLRRIRFQEANVHRLTFDPGRFDLILFHSSLHHFGDIEGLVRDKIRPWLKPGGLLIINEYVGPDRLQYPDSQIRAINEALQTIPESCRIRFKTGLVKRRYRGPGYLRMILADPSECRESRQIRSVLRRSFEIVEEKPYGGNLLMPVLKDIAHHFAEDTPGQQLILDKLFQLEDAYLKKAESDFLFGLYRKS